MTPPLSTERRRLLLASTSILKALGHSGFERMLLELGVPEDVGVGSSLQQRANSLARFALSNQDAKALGGGVLTDAILSRARDAFANHLNSNVNERERFEYQEALAQDDGVELTKVIARNVDRLAPIDRPISSPEVLTDALAALAAQPRPKARRKVFIVHGHDEGPREAIARFLGQLNFEPVILHERPNRGRTIITKFQQEAADVGFAVVVMTPDDAGGKVGTPHRHRARQNVVFELGFFIGALGPERVAAVVKGNIEKPSDFDGILYVQYDDNGAWKQALGRELEAASFEIDWKKAMG